MQIHLTYLRGKKVNSVVSTLLSVVALTALGPNYSGAETPAKPAGKQWAVLIGVEAYEHVMPLKFTVNDVRQLKKTLIEVAGYSPENILQITDQTSGQPKKATIMAVLPDWLKQVGPNDTLLVFFSGHGFLDAGNQKKGYLAPMDVVATDLTGTGIATAWIREQLAACPAGAKLLILDSCHAGAQKGEEEKQGVSASVLSEAFRDMEGVVTLASSSADQKSLIWEGREQSLFSYWLNLGLKGNADQNHDGEINIDELFAYVSRNVQRVAKDRFGVDQDPRRIIGSDVTDIHMVVRVKPQSLAQVLHDMSAQMADLMELRKYDGVGVLEFKGGGMGEVLGQDFGILGNWCADEVQRELLDFCNGKFSVIDRQRLEAEMEKHGGFGLKDLHSNARLQQLYDDVKSASPGEPRAAKNEMPILAEGTFRHRDKHIVYLQCELVETNGKQVIGQVAGAAALSDREWGMLGRSAQVKPVTQPAPSINAPVKATAEQKIDVLDQRAAGPHPLQDPKFPWPIKIVLQDQQGTYQERKGIFRGNDYIVPLRKGEAYEIWVENRSGQDTFMQLLVDGLNTLRQAESTKGLATIIIHPRVSLENARPWFIAHNVAMVGVPGYCIDEGPEGGFGKFIVSTASQSVAGRLNFTDQIGIITVAFYGPKKSANRGGSIGTDMGEKVRRKILEKNPNILMGDMQAVVNIRYADADSPEFAKQ